MSGVVVDVADRLPAPRRALVEVTWDPWPGYPVGAIGASVAAAVRRHTDALRAELARLAADVRMAEATDPDRLAAAGVKVGSDYSDPDLWDCEFEDGVRCVTHGPGCPFVERWAPVALAQEQAEARP